ncbi:MAG: hypothetical protein M1827_004508 [Pycnora praestabilis]|nr:MAG: hypothetical protein M1827_004508 [Pycnora praestabilis]
MTISSFFVFTSLLFLSGYILQQQTVRSLQQAIKPPTPHHRITPTLSLSLTTSPASSDIHGVAQVFGDPPGSKGYGAYQDYITNADGSVSNAATLKKIAHVQLVTDHLLVCSSVMLFGELHRKGSLADKVLLFPKAWAEAGNESRGGSVGDPYLETSRRLLRRAVKRYGVILRPVGPVVEGADEDSPAAYSLASLLLLTEYHRILYLSPSGLILDHAPLDELLASISSEVPLLISPSEAPSSSSTLPTSPPSLLLLEPSTEDYNRALTLISPETLPVSTLFTSLYPDSSAPTTHPLIIQTSSLHHQLLTDNQTSNSTFPTHPFPTSAYIHITDPNLPGPEHDIPHQAFLAAQPETGKKARIWEDVYEKFRQLRMDICGLDLEPWVGADDGWGMGLGDGGAGDTGAGDAGAGDAGAGDAGAGDAGAGDAGAGVEGGGELRAGEDEVV